MQHLRLRRLLWLVMLRSSVKAAWLGSGATRLPQSFLRRGSSALAPAATAAAAPLHAWKAEVLRLEPDTGPLVGATAVTVHGIHFTRQQSWCRFGVRTVPAIMK